MLTLLADLTPASAVCLSISVYAAASIPVLLVPADVDPAPAVRRIVTVLVQGAVRAGHDLNRAYVSSQRAAQDALREAALTVAALLILTIPTGDRS